MRLFKEFLLDFIQQVKNYTHVAVWVLICFDIIGVTNSSIKQFLSLVALSFVADILSIAFRKAPQTI